jgi:hypothetical protein
MANQESMKQVTPVVKRIKVICLETHTSEAPKGCIWPVACPYCSSDAAPKTWWRHPINWAGDKRAEWLAKRLSK